METCIFSRLGQHHRVRYSTHTPAENQRHAYERQEAVGANKETLYSHLRLLLYWQDVSPIAISHGRPVWSDDAEKQHHESVPA